ncbi:MAG: hypothetical protein ACR2HN_10675 [Tepidiformaceae bacterium]
MPYIRLSIARARKGQEQRLEDILNKFCEAALEHPGCRASYLLRPHDESGDLARIVIYDDEHSGEGAAGDEKVMALRSEMHLIVEPGHVERAFFTI